MKSLCSIQCVVLAQLVLSHIFTTILAQQSSSISTACNPAADCTECMTAHPACNWCIAKPAADNKGWSSLDKRCDTYDNLINKKCGADNVKNITTEYISRQEDAVRDATDDQPSIQLSPQKLDMVLRPNEKVKVDLTYRLAEDYPVDLYYLMDLSQSMGDDKKKVADLGIRLAEEMRKITKDVKLGFGSFVDKVLMPYVNTLPKTLKSPCSDCESPYSFKHRLSLSEDTSIFGLKVSQTNVSGNLDEPEGGFDALMQAIVCGSDIGWRSNSRKMLIFSTDASFHSAGDGKLGGVVEPNDGLCHMSNGEYTWGGKQDYPSISQIASKVEDNRMNVIFAVTVDQTERYQALSDLIQGSVTGELAGDSSNIVDLVKENYKKISSKVKMAVRRGNTRNEFLNVKLRADCDETGRFADVAECGNLNPGGSVKFEVELQATSCENAKSGELTETFEVYPTGLTESLQITARVDCSCTCDDAEVNSTVCADVGTYQCGICDCGDSNYGDKCQCDVSTIGTDTEDFYATCKRPSNTTQNQQPCSGHGECVCGTCQTCDCLPGYSNKKDCTRFTGEFCQCNPDNCPRNNRVICSGRGECRCDEGTAVHTCECDSGYNGTQCECRISQDTCIDPKTQIMCNGQGPCECGDCKCEKPVGDGSERYTGQYCEECSTCSSKCQYFKQCVQCQVYRLMQWKEDTYDAEFCEKTCFNGTTTYELVKEIPNGDNVRFCTGYTSAFDDCQVVYGYKYVPRTGYTVYMKDEKECPVEVNLIAIILGVIGGVVFLGVIALLIWKLVTSLHDRREFAKFEKESKQAEWNSNENPIYVQATSTFKNPMYQGSMKKS